MKTLLIVISILTTMSVFSQNITNTLGTNGLFTIKDASNNYLTLSQSTGQVNILKTLRLENTTNSGLGIIFKGAERFLHNYGTNNTFLGINSGNFTMTGVGANTAVGDKSLYSNTTGFYNTAVGMSSLFSNTSGIGNTALGNNAGSSITTGSNLTCIGFGAEPTSGSANDQIILGGIYVTSLRCAVQTITGLSDARDKKNITDLSLGLDFLMKVKPRLFNWDKREWYENNISDGSKMKEAPTAGFIAQELDEVQATEDAEWLNLVLKDNPEKFEATYGNLLPVMVKGIQELNTKCEELKTENDELKNNNEMLAAEVKSFKSMSEKLVKLEQLVNELTSVKHTTLITKNQNLTISKKGEEK